MTLGNFYKKATKRLKEAGIDSAFSDVSVLMNYVLTKDKSFVITHPEMPLTNSQYARLSRLLKRRLKNEPIAYITGHKEFFGLDFLVNRSTLIPRPESEELVTLALQRIKGLVSGITGKSQKLKTKYSILDMGTGSGSIIISIAKELDKLDELSTCNLVAIDISTSALRVAKMNAKIHDVDVKFFHSDLFSNSKTHKRYDIIIANLPYVPLLSKEGPGAVQEIDFEPASAIFAEDNGTATIKRFLTYAKKYLNVGGTILLELDPRNASQIRKFAGKIYSNVKLKKDLAGHIRYMVTN